MQVILKNNTESNIFIPDLQIVVTTTDNYNLTTRFPNFGYRSSEDLIQFVSNGDITVNDYSSDIINKIDAINYILGREIFLAGNKSIDGRSSFQITPRPNSTTTLFTGVGDSDVDQSAIGGGQSIELDFVSGVSTYPIQPIKVWFNTIVNPTFIHDAIISFQNCKIGDRVSVHIIPKTTSYTISTNTNFNLYGGYLIIGANGNGTISVNQEDIKLIEVPLKYGVRTGPGMWDATFNIITKEFENIIPNINGTGQFNIFAVEIEFVEFVCNWTLLGNVSGIKLVTTDVEQLGHNMGLRFDFTTNNDHNFQFAVLLHIFREKTC